MGSELWNPSSESLEESYRNKYKLMLEEKISTLERGFMLQTLNNKLKNGQTECQQGEDCRVL